MTDIVTEYERNSILTDDLPTSDESMRNADRSKVPSALKMNVHFRTVSEPTSQLFEVSAMKTQ